MPITRFLSGPVFSPADIVILSTAFEDALRALNLTNRDDPTTEIVAKKIIEIAKQGERDPVRLRERAVQALTNEPSGRSRRVGRLSWRPRQPVDIRFTLPD
jgi:hypothetical protein